MNNVPGKERKEWRELLTGQLEFKLDNFVLQMQIDQTRRAIDSSRMTLEEGVDKIHALCEKYSLAVYPDMQTIFKI